MFVGRHEELAAMERLYEKDSFQMLVLYGRRRVGKTTLLEHFSKGKDALFFTAKEQSSGLNLRDLSRTIFEHQGLSDTAATFETWEAAFSYLAERVVARVAPAEKLLFIFDEFPYAAATDPSLPSVLQVAIDRMLKDKNILLVLSGSNEGFMESRVLGNKSPLYGRRTAQIKLQPFDYFDAAKMTPLVSEPTELLRYYATFGGTPYYLAQIDDRCTYEENVEELFFRKSGLLYEEPLMLLRQELREPSLYNSILYAVASGATSPKEISERSGVEATTTSRYLKTLEDLGLVTRLVPFGNDPQRSKKGLYKLKDPFFAYWYRFVGPNLGAIEAGAGHAVVRQRAFGEPLDTYKGRIFEEVCLQWLKRANREGELPFLATAFGSWWGTDPDKHEQTDIDVVAADKGEESILLGECKWRESFDESDALGALEDRSRLIGGYSRRWLYLFTKHPVSPQTKRKAAGERIAFVDADDLYRLVG